MRGASPPPQSSGRKPLKLRQRSPGAPVTIESLDNEGRGVARVEGKAVFVEGALPGERVLIETIKRKPSLKA